MARQRSLRAHLSGAAAEDIAARHYEARGCTVAARRWRGPAGGGEIDLILRCGRMVIFAEVKHSRSHGAAAARITPAQAARIMAGAAQFLEGEPAGQLTEARFDAVLIDGQGRIDVIENAFGQG